MDNDDGGMSRVTDGQPALRPVLRWESVLPHPSFRSFMMLPTPLAPTGVGCKRPAALGATMAHQVASSLCRTSTSFL